MAPWVKLRRELRNYWNTLCQNYHHYFCLVSRIFLACHAILKKKWHRNENKGTKAKLIMWHSTHIRPDRHHVEKNRGWGNVSILEQTCNIYICSMFIHDMNGTIGICGHWVFIFIIYWRILTELFKRIDMRRSFGPLPSRFYL